MLTLSKTLARLALAASLLAPLGHAPACAGPETPTTRSTPGTTGRAESLDRTFDALALAEDESLTSRRASGEEWSTGEIVVVVLLLIFLFPIGLIVLIILLIVKA